MPSAWPGAYDSFTNPTQSNELDDVGVEHDLQHGKENDGVYAIQHALGTDPRGAYPTVQARLDAVDTSIASLGGGGATIGNLKKSVRAVATENITLSGGATVDKWGFLGGTGVALATNDRVLVTGQTTATQNGIYVVNTAGSWTRATDANTGALLKACLVQVEEGDVQKDSLWQCTNDGTITIGSTNITFRECLGSGGTGGRPPFVTVCASNAPPNWRFSCDVICTGTNDGDTINGALLFNYGTFAAPTPAGSNGDAQMGTVYLSPGLFLINTAVAIPTGGQLVGNGMGDDHGGAGHQWERGTVLQNSASGAAHSVVDFNTGSINTWTRGQALRHLTIDGMDCTVAALKMWGCTSWHIENVNVWAANAAGVEFRAAQDGVWFGGRFDWCGTTGASGGAERAAIHMIPQQAGDNTHCNNIDFYDITLENCRDGDIWMLGGSGSNNVNKCTFVKIKAERHTQYNYAPIRLDYASHSDFLHLDCTVGGAKQNGANTAQDCIKVTNSSNCWFRSIVGEMTSSGTVTGIYDCVISFDGCTACGVEGVGCINQSSTLTFVTAVLKFTGTNREMHYEGIAVPYQGSPASTTPAVSGAASLIDCYKNSGVVTPANAATTTVVTHNLRCVPDPGFPQVTAFGNLTGLYVTSITATQFTINHSAGDGVKTIGWYAEAKRGVN